jgi:hypothetical protein
MMLPLASAGGDLINVVSRSAALNPAEMFANQPNFAQGDPAAAVGDFQGFCAISHLMRDRLPCRRSRVRVPSAASDESAGNPKLFPCANGADRW